MLAAELGLPYAFASHFAPEQLIPALQIYRSRFKPSEQLDRPYAMVGVNIIAAESDAEARRLATTQQMSFANLFRGARGLSQPPIDDIESYWSPAEKAQAMRMLARSIVGSPDTVRAGIDALVAETGADELIVVSDVYDHATRLRSFELIADAAGIGAGTKPVSGAGIIARVTVRLFDRCERCRNAARAHLHDGAVAVLVAGIKSSFQIARIP